MGKGRIIRIVSDVFSQYEQEIFYSPFEREFPCAVYIPKLNALIVSDYNEFAAERMNCRWFDTGKATAKPDAPLNGIIGYTMNQSRAYMEKSVNLLGISNLLMREYVRSSSEALEAEKLKAYSKRKITSLLKRKRMRVGREYIRSVSAVTCSGYRVAELPEDYTVIRLCDNLFAASALFAQTASSAANTMGYDTVISKAVDTENSPMHLIIPEIRTAFLSESEIFKNKSAVNRKLNLNRFYIPEFLEARAHSSEFCGECIKKLLDEAALYARICMDIKNQGRRLIEPYISEKDLSDIASEIVYTIMNQGN